jgi:hypothetical protein
VEESRSSLFNITVGQTPLKPLMQVLNTQGFSFLGDSLYTSNSLKTPYAKKKNLLVTKELYHI